MEYRLNARPSGTPLAPLALALPAVPPAILLAVLIAGLIAVLTAALPVALRAQVSPRRWEVRVASGAMLPVAEFNRSIARGHLTAAQVAWLPDPSLALVTTLGWAKSRDLVTAGEPTLHAYTVDFGLEVRPEGWVQGGRLQLSPFVGSGAGARRYDGAGRAGSLPSTIAGYGSVGGELGMGRIGLRLEARHYLSAFAADARDGARDPRRDVQLLATLRFNRRADTHR